MTHRWPTRFPPVDFEAWAWAAGLVWLAMADPLASTAPALCLFRWAGVTWCPGCGLGRSVALLLHGDWRASLWTHPLGAVAVPVLGCRIVTLIQAACSHPADGGCGRRRRVPWAT